MNPETHANIFGALILLSLATVIFGWSLVLYDAGFFSWFWAQIGRGGLIVMVGLISLIAGAWIGKLLEP